MAAAGKNGRCVLRARAREWPVRFARAPARSTRMPPSHPPPRALPSFSRFACCSFGLGNTVRAVVFDWAGTIVDYGSCAPAEAFIETFRRAGVAIDAATARGPMGKNKRDHIAEIIYAPHVAAAWAAAHGGRAPAERDVDDVYAAFTPVQVAAAAARAAPVPGALATLAALRARGVKVGSCSGYNAAIMEAVVAGARAHGLAVDAVECAGPANGRPRPWMSTRVLEALDAYPLHACVKVDDTVPGIAEGLNAGMWTVGVARSGNELGLDEAAEAALLARAPAEHARLLAAARERLRAAGAHFVIDSVADFMPVVDKIEALQAAGVSPLHDAAREE